MKFFSPSLTNGVVWNIRSEIHYFRLVHTRYIEKNVNKKLLKICKKQLTGSVNKPGDIIKDPWFSLYKLLMISNKSDVFFTGKNLDLETLKNYWISILRKNNILRGHSQTTWTGFWTIFTPPLPLVNGHEHFDDPP